MCRKLFYLVSVLFLSLACISKADESLVAYYAFENDVLDQSGNELHGSIVGDPFFTNGAFGMALDFDGDGDYIDCGNDPNFGMQETNQMTVATWVTIRSIAHQWAAIVAKSENAWRLGNASLDPVFHFGIKGSGSDTTYFDGVTAVGFDEWHHVAGSFDGENMMIYLDGALDNSVSTTESIGLGTPTVLIGENPDETGRYWDGLVDEVYIYNRALTEMEIYTLMVGGDASIAWKPRPDNGQVEVTRDVVLGWNAGEFADKHNVYLGTDVNDVNEASIDNPLGVLVSQNHEDTTYNHPDYLEFEQTYYWRIDEVNDLEPNSPWKSNVWSFTTANYIVVDDFEDYNDFPPKEIFNTWLDGWEDPTNGSTSGHPAPDFVGGEHYLEHVRVHRGHFSFPVYYDNSVGLSEVTRSINADWTDADVITLTLFYYGDAGNDIEPMYVALNDNATITNGDTRSVLVNEWTQWDILLQDFADMDVDLTNVNSMSIGFGNKANPTAGGEGHVLFDDIRLYRSPPVEFIPGPEPVDPGTANLEAYYDFENDARDNSGNNRHGAAMNNPGYTTGPTGFGSAIELNGLLHYVEFPIGSLISTLTDCTIATWVNWSGQGGAWQRIFDFGNPPATADDEPMVWMFLSANAPGFLAFSVALEGNAGVQDITTGELLPTGWHHVAVTIDSTNMVHTLYLDGEVVGQNTDATHLPSDLGQTTQNWIGRSQWAADAYFDGAVDEFRIYNRVLSDAEILFLMDR